MDNSNNLKVIFSYGSQVYGNTTETSDKDYIAIGMQAAEINTKKVNIRILPLQDFLLFTEMHEVSIIECISLILTKQKNFYKIYDRKFLNILRKYYRSNFNLIKLRKAVSQKSSNSFIKAKKKILIPEENSYLGVKSLFHSIRILDFGYQIATAGHIINFQSCNDIWQELYKNKEIFENCKTEEEFKEIVAPWKKIYNKKHSELKIVTEK